MFFFRFLHAGGRWKEFLKNCPLSYTGNRGSGAAKVMGTVLLSVLSGHWRYAHINGVRGDGINPGLLGIGGTVSEDAVRLAMGRIEEKAGLDWLSGQVVDSIAPVLGLPWILDIDVTVKPLYGSQQGAKTGYNPQKPGRPSHVYHSYFVANLRISLGVEVRPGNEHAAARGMPELWNTLAKLPRSSWPTYARGDCGYGNQAVISEFEERALPYLFKLRHTPKVKELVKVMMGRGALWQDCGDGWQALESSIKLKGWTRERRVVLVRENPSRAPIALPESRDRRSLPALYRRLLDAAGFDLPDADRGDSELFRLPTTRGTAWVAVRATIPGSNADPGQVRIGPWQAEIAEGGILHLVDGQPVLVEALRLSDASGNMVEGLGGTALVDSADGLPITKSSRLLVKLREGSGSIVLRHQGRLRAGRLLAADGRELAPAEVAQADGVVTLRLDPEAANYWTELEFEINTR